MKTYLSRKLRDATKRIAPVWPLDRFVAVNPYLGLLDESFEDAAVRLARVAGARSTMKLSRDDIDRADLEAVISQRGSRLTTARVLELLEEDGAAPTVATVADVLDEVTGQAWSRFVREQLGAWFAAYFDEDYAAWQPDRAESLFATWKAEAEIDRTPEIMGAAGFRATIRALPDDFEEAACEALLKLDLPRPGLELYLHRLLMTLGGWSANAARVVWDRRLYDDAEDDTLVELLAVLLVFEYALYESFRDGAAKPSWRAACEETGRIAKRSTNGGIEEARVLAQLAYEKRFERKLDAYFDGAPEPAPRQKARPKVQAAFCIDVRSEVFRRNLEVIDASTDTIGFAGFFGFPVEYVPVGHDDGGKQCPVLLKPSHRVSETGAQRPVVEQQLLKRAWQSFKMGAISCFSFVGPVGLAYLPKLFADAYGVTRPVLRTRNERAIDLERAIPLEDRIEMAAGALTAMSLTSGFARIVMLAGHGSTSTNNPHASGLDCGACGGRTGAPNVRVAVAILNDTDVRKGLRARGIAIPDDTIFIAALHDTTTDEVSILERHVPATHKEDLARLRRSLAAAAEASRRERTRRVSATDDVDWFRRSRDWAQVRPEWGLAGCASFVVAPRERTAGRDLEGRAFLHSYSWKQDDEFSVLELIMTAPMIVASWINLQYYASSVDPDVFGAGNKTLHNVVGGTVGVLEGNTGDLRVGLPWQSVHDGERFQHEPVRLNVVIEAPIDAMNRIIEKHESVRQLLDNGWIRLFGLDESGSMRFEYVGGLEWRDREIDDVGREWQKAS